MATIFDGRINVHYGFWSISETDGDPGDLTAAFEGQTNGLLGGQVPGSLWARTGLHTGPVPLRVEVTDVAQPVAEVWEDVVEVSFQPPRAATLGAFEEFHELPDWPSETWLRARLHARSMDPARAADSLGHDEDPIDEYLLVVWPEDAPRPDEVLLRTSTIADHWHGSTTG